MWNDFTEVRGCVRDCACLGGVAVFFSLVCAHRRTRAPSTSTALSLIHRSPPSAPTPTQQCVRATDDPRKCKEKRDDYLECLHHRKEFTRLNAIYRETQRQAAAGEEGVKAGAAAGQH